MDELELIFNFGTFLYILVQQYTAQPVCSLAPLTSTWPHQRFDVGLETGKGEYAPSGGKERIWCAHLAFIGC